MPLLRSRNDASISIIIYYSLIFAMGVQIWSAFLIGGKSRHTNDYLYIAHKIESF